MTTLPTVAELNELSASHCALLLLRVLGTSDLTFFHSLLKPETRADIVDVCSDMLACDGDDAMSSSEYSEFRGLLAEILG